MGQIVSSWLMKFFIRREVCVLMLGLDGSGKTTILYKLKLGTIVRTIHTIGSNNEIINHRGMSFRIYDVGWSCKMLDIWLSQYYSVLKCQGLIFVVDCSEPQGFDSVQDELLKFVKHDQLIKDVVLLIYANKQDLPGAFNADELKERLGLDELLKGYRWHIENTSAVQGFGMRAGLDWLYHEIYKTPVTLTEV